MRRRRLKGWSDVENIEGKRNCAAPNSTPEQITFPPDFWPGDLENQKQWERSYQRYKENPLLGKPLTRIGYVLNKIKSEMFVVYHHVLKHDPNGCDDYGEPYTEEAKEFYFEEQKRFEKLKALYKKYEALLPPKPEPKAVEPTKPKFW
jgi:hypothetical protein